MALIALFWATSSVREIRPDSQVVVRRFGRIVRTQQSGLLLAWPRPIEQVQVLPGPARQLSLDVSVLLAPSNKYQAIVGFASQGTTGAEAYLTGDGNVVLLSASLIYRIDDPIEYALEAAHVAPALDRLFRATAVHITAGRNLNDFLVVQTNADQSHNVIALRSEVRESLLRSMNDRLHALDASGAGLGVEIEQIDLAPSLPPVAKAAFDQVLVATQAADRGVAIARTDAERQRQQAAIGAEHLVSDAQATAKEIVSKASVDTASILALEHDEKIFRSRNSRNSLLLREYRARVVDIMNRTGHVTLVDPKSGVRIVLPGKQP
ncbi:MAG TPA: SPFH domain-containing protein [Bryobacteraceae bacterium]|nr:SPFH domain-containing protein [Bryobacteraceae bacterium]